VSGECPSALFRNVERKATEQAEFLRRYPRTKACCLFEWDDNSLGMCGLLKPAITRLALSSAITDAGLKHLENFVHVEDVVLFATGISPGAFGTPSFVWLHVLKRVCRQFMPTSQEAALSP
jgi:hypothetical protein